MDQELHQHIKALHSKDPEQRNASFQHIMELTKEPVKWAYDAWDDMLSLIQHGDDHQRAMGVQVLSNLAKCDPKQRMINDLSKLLKVTKDEKFVTARHALQCLWKIGVVNQILRNSVIDGLSRRFRECIDEKNCTLIRHDIMVVFRKMYDHTQDEKIASKALALINTESDEKYKMKYLEEWKDILKNKSK